MTAQDTVRRLAEADPVPDAGRLHTDHVDAERLFSSIETRREELIGAETRPSSTRARPPRSRPWHRNSAAVFLAAVVTVLAAATPLAIFIGRGSDVAENPAPTATVPKATDAVPATTVASEAPTTVASEAIITERPLVLDQWQLVTPTLDLGGASGSAFTRIVATDLGFVATSVSFGDGIWTSPDGVEWTQVGDPSDPVGLGVAVGFSDLAVNGDRIAAVINDSFGVLGTGAIATSTNAENWMIAVLPEYSEGDSVPLSPQSIAAFGTDGFIVSGDAIWLSTDGEEYDLLDTAFPLIDGRTSASDGQTAVLGTSVAELLVTQDGETWEFLQLVGVDGDGQSCSMVSLENLAHGPAGFVAVGNCGQYGTAWTSPDGFVWSQIPFDATSFGVTAWPYSIASSERGYVVGGHSHAGPDREVLVPTVWTSSDGVEWTRVVLETSVVEDGGVLGVAIHDDSLIAVGWVDSEGAIWRAPLTD